MLSRLFGRRRPARRPSDHRPRQPESPRLRVEALEDRVTPAVNFVPNAFVVAGAEAGVPPEVRVFDPATDQLITQFLAYNPNFLGGVRVAVGDVNGDDIPDLATGAGPTGTPLVKVFSGSNAGQLLSIFAFERSFTGGVYVALGDLTGDAKDELIVGAGGRGAPVVSVFDATTGEELARFFAYDPAFRGGVRVAAGDVNGDGIAEIITAPGAGGGPHVRAFELAPRGGQEPRSIVDFFALDPSFGSGVFVGAGDLDGDNAAEIITGAAQGGGPVVRVFDPPTATPLPGTAGAFFAFDPALRGGVHVYGADLDDDPGAEIVAGPGPGGIPQIRVFDGPALREQDATVVFPEGYKAGLHVAAGAGPVNFPSTPDAEIAAAFIDLQESILRRRALLQAQPELEEDVDPFAPFIGDPFAAGFLGVDPLVADPFVSDPFFFDAPALINPTPFFGPEFFPTPGFLADPGLGAGFFGAQDFFVNPGFAPTPGLFPSGIGVNPLGTTPLAGGFGAPSFVGGGFGTGVLPTANPLVTPGALSTAPLVGGPFGGGFGGLPGILF